MIINEKNSIEELIRNHDSEYHKGEESGAWNINFDKELIKFRVGS